MSGIKNKVESPEFKEAIGKGIADFNQNKEKLAFIEVALKDGAFVKKKDIDELLGYFLAINTKLKFAEGIAPFRKRDLALTTKAIDETIRKTRYALEESHKYQLENGFYHKI